MAETGQYERSLLGINGAGGKASGICLQDTLKTSVCAKQTLPAFDCPASRHPVSSSNTFRQTLSSDQQGWFLLVSRR